MLVLLSACSSSAQHSAATTAGTTPPTTLPASTTDASSATSTASTTSTVEPTTTEPRPVQHVVPVLDAASVGFSDTHHDYPATDIFHPDNCGTPIVSPVDGVVLELRRTDPWDPALDDPATRGGLFVSILGDDGVRYYLAHLSALDDGLEAGTRLAAGDPVGLMGDTGKAGACHLHLGISPPCPTDDWWVRRGVVWPYPYLRDWLAGGNASPAEEVSRWVADHPGACDAAP
ncbi:MAG: M23 family metallopeptidase [Ilumatobacteraceae bacterium]